jgi:hypothetical protein
MSKIDLDTAWRLTEHACGYCGGRILSAVDDESHVRCSCCDAEDGDGPHSFCYCGADMGDAPMEFGCILNPDPGQSGSDYRR